MRLDKKTAIVTGAAQGIGLACAHALAQAGARVVLADINSMLGVKSADAVGHGAWFVTCDVGDAESVAGLVETVEKAFGHIDILVNNAAVVHGADFLEISEADFDSVIRTNLKGAFLVGQTVARSMVRRQQRGAIINMSSINAVVAIGNQVPYSVAKGGLNQLTKVMALALAPHGIRVNGIGPGSIGTEMLKAVMADDGARRTVLSRTPMGRIGEPDEIARIAVFLASDDSSYVTGQTLYADGGRLALNYVVPVPD